MHPNSTMLGGAGGSAPPGGSKSRPTPRWLDELDKAIEVSLRAVEMLESHLYAAGVVADEQDVNTVTPQPAAPHDILPQLPDSLRRLTHVAQEIDRRLNRLVDRLAL